jgi:chromosome segregation ATPase
MRAKFTGTLSFLLLLLLLSPVTASAQLFGADDEDLNKIEFELKKFNTHLENLKNTELSSLRAQQEDFLRQIEDIKQILPQLQGAVELNKSQTLSGLSKTNAKLDDLQAEVKNQVLQELNQQNKILELFKESLKQDMEELGNSSKSNFQEFSKANQETLGKVVQELEAQSATTKKGFDDTIALFRTDVIPAMAEENQTNRKIIMDQLAQANKDTQKSLEAFSANNKQLNQRLIEILQESLKQGLETKSLLDAIKKDMGIIQESLVGTNQNMADNHSVIAEIKKAMSVTNNNLIVADEKTNKLAESLMAMQNHNTESSEVLSTLKADLEQTGEFNKLADEKFNMLIELSAKLATHSTELESSVVGQLKDSAQKEDTRTTKVDLANEKLSRLIEILKTIVKEQAKLDPVATTLGDIQKEQKALQKAQAGFKKDQAAIKEALADLRRKANVNISRNDDIKKTLGQLSPAKN